MSNQPIAVLGGGNIGHTIAADLSLGGYEVNFYEHPQFEDAFKTTLEKGIVEIEDQRTGRHELARIHKVTTDIKAAISGVQLIFVAIPSFGQDLFFNTMIPYLKDGQVVFIMSGNFGSLRLRKLLKEKATGRKITIYETSTMPYATRLSGPASVRVIFGFGPWLGTQPSFLESFVKDTPKKGRLISALPAKDTDVALKEFQKLYPLFSPAKNVLVGAANNINFIIHPIPAVLNAGRIEYANLYSKEDFYLHREGHTPSVQRVEEVVVDEIAALVRVLGGEMTIPRTSGKNYFNHAQTHPSPAGPKTVKHRYIAEDTAYGFVPMSQLGEKLGVAMPLMNALIDIASVMNQEDYRKTGRTLETMGLDRLNKEQIINLVEKGS